MPREILRRVKIVCTLGPSSDSVQTISKMIRGGMDVARLNFSHGSHDFHEKLLKNVREASPGFRKPVAVMQDLQGPKIRVGKLPKEGVLLEEGDEVILYPDGGSPKSSLKGRKGLPISAEIAAVISRDVQKGARILFDDGKLSSVVKSVNPPEICVEFKNGGKLTSFKGMNLPGTPLSVACCTEKDLVDLKFGLSIGVDAVALSFVRRVEDLEFVRKQIKKMADYTPLVISKIEREEAVESYEEIIEVSDGLLIARGDMAVEMGADQVPVIQKKLIHASNEVGVPVITATQMLESMISSPVPTRAEASDVANSVFDGTDAVMLSAETATGMYPVETVETMSKIVFFSERNASSYSTYPAVQPMAGSIVDSVEYSAAKIAAHVGASLIACITHSGRAARASAKYRPGTPIIAIMDNEEALRKLAFVWGVFGTLIPKIVETEDLFATIEKVVISNKWAEIDDLIVVTAGFPTLRRGTTNMIKVHRVGHSMERASRRL